MLALHSQDGFDGGILISGSSDHSIRSRLARSPSLSLGPDEAAHRHQDHGHAAQRRVPHEEQLRAAQALPPRKSRRGSQERLRLLLPRRIHFHRLRGRPHLRLEHQGTPTPSPRKTESSRTSSSATKTESISSQLPTGNKSSRLLTTAPSDPGTWTAVSTSEFTNSQTQCRIWPFL